MTTVVTLTINNCKCEILCKKETVLAYRNKKLLIDDVLISDEIYKNASRGNVLSSVDFSKIFDKKTKQEALKIILESGNYKLTTNEIREQIKQKRNQLIHYIKSNYVHANGNIYSIEQIDTILTKCNVKINLKVSCEHIFKQNRRKIENYMVLKISKGLQTTYTIPYDIYGKVQNVLYPYQTNITYNDANVVIDINIPNNKIECITNILGKYNI